MTNGPGGRSAFRTLQAVTQPTRRGAAKRHTMVEGFTYRAAGPHPQVIGGWVPGLFLHAPDLRHPEAPEHPGAQELGVPTCQVAACGSSMPRSRNVPRALQRAERRHGERPPGGAKRRSDRGSGGSDPLHQAERSLAKPEEASQQHVPLPCCLHI